MLSRPATLLGAVFVVGLAVMPVASAAPPKDAKLVQPAFEVAKVPSPNLGASYLRALGKFAGPMLARDGVIGALVALPKGSRAQDFGLDPVAPGIGRLRGTPEGILAFADAHPALPIEIGPTLKPLMNQAGAWVRTNSAHLAGNDGRGVLIGIADTGLDVLSKEFRTPSGESRVAWMLDLSLKPSGAYPELEQRFGVKNAAGEVVAGRVFSKHDIDVMISRYDAGVCVESGNRDPCAPTDEQGHGTHVTGIAAASGVFGFAGTAPAAEIISVRIVRGAFDGILNDDLERAVEFMFDRADAEQKPMVVNLSLGADFGPHDGTTLWEQAIASHVGPDHPGRAIVAAAGNSGSILESPIHQSVRVSRGTRVRVPVRTGGADSGQVQIWVTLRPGADLEIGLEGPDGEWIPPVPEGRQNAKNTDDYQSGVIYGANHEGSVIPPASRGAIVVWTGRWPRGTYYVTLEGSGMAELYLQGLGDASLGSSRAAFFTNAVRENTITLPGTHPSIIAVGCTVNRTRWTSVGGVDIALKSPLLDEAGAIPLIRLPRPEGGDPFQTHRELLDGEVCWFSSAGPTVTGVPKPEIAAPGALVASTVSRTARPPNRGSIFTNEACPKTETGRQDDRCMLVDELHGVSNGTSMSSPMVAGIVAILLQQDRTLTQDKILALLQAGAHRFRASHVFDAFDDQSGPGEVDALGALDALEQMKNPVLHLPSYEQSWITLSAEYVAADGSTPMTAIVELRTADGQHRGDFFDASRLKADLRVDGQPVDPQPEMIRRGPGVWFYTWHPPAGLGGSRATFGATFDGAPIVPSRTIPIAVDRWAAAYPSEASGSGCGATGHGGGFAWPLPLLAVLAAVLRRRARAHSSASVTSQPWGSHTASSGSN